MLKRIGKGLLFLLLFLDVRSLISQLVQLLVPFQQDYFLVHFIAGCIVFVIGLGLARYFNIHVFNKQSLTLKNIGFATIVVFANLLLTGILTSILPKANFDNQQAVLAAVQQSSVLGSILSVALVGPILEEFVFRGVFMTAVFPAYSLMGGLVSAALFSFLHSGFSLTPFIIYFVLGAGFSVIYTKTRSLETAMYAHILHNSIALLLMYGGI